LAPVLREGSLLAGKYRIERQLGEGGMGYVVAAVHEQLEQRVAVKFLSATHAKNREAATRFLREARAAVRIQSEHVARVIDVAELEDGSPYMVMEFLDGSDLSAELGRSGVFAPHVAVDYVLQACEAVAEAHALGLVHRDLKPANLFLTRRADGSPLVKVLDFGISKAVSTTTSSGESAALTSAQTILGSPAYMSPEQARKPKSVDARTDIWSLGIILYEFLTGEVPFSGDTLLSVIAAAFSEQQRSVREIRPDLAVGLEAAVDRCLEKSPDDRFQSVAELAEALAPYAEPHSLPSVNRIRGTVQRASSIPPSRLSDQGPSRFSRTPDDTLPNNERPANTVAAGDSDTLALLGAPASGVTPKSETLTDWGATGARTGRSRRVLIAGGGAAALLVLLVLLVLASSHFASRAGASDSPSVSAAPPEEHVQAARPEREASPPAPVVAPVPVVSPETMPLPTSSASSVAPAAPKPPRPAAVTAKHPKAAGPTSTGVQPLSPLDGRL
jgi:serine/threonine-protein kinase